MFELGIFDSAINLSFSRIMLIWNCAFLSGRSKQGNARLASIGENCVLASHLKMNRIKENALGYDNKNKTKSFSI